VDFDLPPLDDLPTAPTICVKRVTPTPTPVFDTYWRFAAERQAIYWRRHRGERLFGAPCATCGTAGPDKSWLHTVNGAGACPHGQRVLVNSTDPILAEHRFTNVYRAADRVSQYLIRNIICAGSQESARDVIFRVLLFKLFNKIETWESVVAGLGRAPRPDLDDTEARWISNILDDRKNSARLYSAAYMMPSPGNAKSKHRAHLLLLNDVVHWKYGVFQYARSLRELYEVLRAVPSFGPFLAYQFAIDLNYSNVFNFDENEFVVPGPGALDGLSKCFSSLGEYDAADAIRWTLDQAPAQFDRLGLRFEPIGSRWPTLIDWQNVYCEISKYARVAHPEVVGVAGRTKIKQRYTPDPKPLPAPFFPSKWRVNEQVAAQVKRAG